MITLSGLKKMRADVALFLAGIDAAIFSVEVDQAARDAAAYDTVPASEADRPVDLGVQGPHRRTVSNDELDLTERKSAKGCAPETVQQVRAALVKARRPLSRGELVKKSGLSDPSVGRALKELGAAVVRKRTGLTVRYALVATEAEADLRVKKPAPIVCEAAARKAPSGVQLDTKPTPTPAPLPAISVPKCADDLLLEIKFGAATPEELQRKTGWPMQTVKLTLAELAVSGVIVGGFLGGSAVRMKGTDA